MARVFDEADYRRRLNEAEEIPVGEEARLLIKGLATGDTFGPLEARVAMNQAKQNALRKARKEIIRAIRAEDDRIRQSGILPIDVVEMVTGAPGDELVKVP